MSWFIARSKRIRLLALGCVLCLVAAACSSSVDSEFSASDDSNSQDSVDQTNEADSSELDTSGAGAPPPALAFVDDPKTLRISLPRLDFVAPHLVDETDPVQVLVTDLLSDGLTVSESTTGIMLPGIASEWSTSSNGLIWTFVLGDSTFGDGTPITADDVVVSLNRVAAQGINSISGPNLWPIQGWTTTAADDSGILRVPGVVALNDSTVEITLDEPFAPLAEVLSGVAFGIWPADVDAASANDSDLPISSAVDFVPTELWADGVRLELDQPIGGEASTIELFVDPTNSMLDAGETDMAASIDPGDELAEGIRGVAVPRSAEAYFGMNADIAPFDDPLIRQAVVRAIDRDEVRNEFFPTAGVQHDLVAQPILGVPFDACGDNCGFDIEQATLLVEASPSRDVAFTVDYFADFASDDVADAANSVDGAANNAGANADDSEQRLAESIAAQLRAIGLDATARGHDPAEYGARVGNGELGLFRFGSVTTLLAPDAQIGTRFHTAGRDNLTATSIDRVDDLIEEARRESDADARAELYSQAELALLGEAVVLPLVEFRHHLAHGPTLIAAGLEPDGSLDLAVIEFAPAVAADDE